MQTLLPVPLHQALKVPVLMNSDLHILIAKRHFGIHEWKSRGSDCKEYLYADFPDCAICSSADSDCLVIERTWRHHAQAQETHVK